MHAQPARTRPVRPPARALLLSAASAVLPGLAHLVAGRRRRALVIGAVAAALLVTLVALAATTSRTEFLRLAVRPGWLAVFATAAVLLALAWAGLVVASYRVSAPGHPAGLPRVVVTATLVVLCLLVATPPLAVARYAILQRNLINSVFPDAPVTAVGDGGRAADRAGRWGGRERVNILLLASDAGPDRTGTRTDSVVLASIDTRTGDVLLMSLPRNLQQVPMPAGPLRDAWPNGFPDLLNGVYQFVTERPGLLAGARDRGAAAVEQVVAGILGVRVDYYALANLEGFQRFVDALGGVQVTVRERLPIGGLTADGTLVPPIGWIEPGTRKMDGYTALWYARSRRNTTDYDRMARQRCLIDAVVHQVDPATVLRNFQSLASATARLMATDIPRALLPDLVDLADRVRGTGQVRSVAFVPPLISTAEPDYPTIRSTVRAALAAAPPAGPTAPPAGAAPTPPPPLTSAPAPTSATAPTATSRSPARATGPVVSADAACGLG